MKGLYLGVVAASLVVVAFSWFYGQKANRLRENLWRPESNQLSRLERDLEYAEFEKNRATLHWIVKIVSIPYFLATLVVLVLDWRKSPMMRGGRVMLALGALVALSMTFWALLLSGAVSFDEVFLVWTVAAVVLAAISGLRLRLLTGAASPA